MTHIPILTLNKCTHRWWLTGLLSCLIWTQALTAVPFGYVCNVDDNTVTPIDLATGTQGTPIPVGFFPRRIAITPDGAMAYVCNSVDNNVTPITLATNTPGTNIPVAHSPEAIAITPDGTMGYVCNYSSAVVTPITLSTNTPGTNIPVGLLPNAIASHRMEL
jgi:YVTN family beta-propeller protein